MVKRETIKWVQEIESYTVKQVLKSLKKDIDFSHKQYALAPETVMGSASSIL